MKIKEGLIREIDDMILINSLSKDGSFEIVAFGDINSIETGFTTVGSGARNKNSIFWKCFDKNFDIENFVDGTLEHLLNAN